MKIFSVMALVFTVMLSNPLAAVKLTVDGFAGFIEGGDSSQTRKSTWRVKALPDSPEIKPEIYSDIEFQVFTTPELPSGALTNYNQIPEAKAYDLVQRDSFQFTTEVQEIQEIELGDFSAPFLNVCITTAHKHWNKDEDNWEDKRIIISHSVVPLESVQPIDSIRIKLLGMSLFSWTLPQQGSFNVRSLHEAMAEGEIIISHAKESERHAFGSWPPSDWFRVEFQDSRHNKSDPSLYLPHLNATISFSNFRAFLFQGDFQDQIKDFQALQEILKRCGKHLIVSLGAEQEDFNIPIVDRDKNLNICIVAKQGLTLSGGITQTADFLLDHLGTKASFLDFSALVLHLTHTQVGDDMGKMAPQAQVSLLEQGHDGIITQGNGSTRWWKQKSF